MWARYKVRTVSELDTQMTGDMSCQKLFITQYTQSWDTDYSWYSIGGLIFQKHWSLYNTSEGGSNKRNALGLLKLDSLFFYS
jgi:hypothetical protein